MMCAPANMYSRISKHTSGHFFDTTVTTPSLSNNVTISKAEYDYLLHAVREYSTLLNPETPVYRYLSNA